MPKPKPWTPRKGERELLDQIRVAAQQLDAERGGRLGWIVRFAREDPALWLPADREAHGYRLLALAHPLFARAPYAPFLVGGSTDLRPLAAREVIALHTELREKLQAMVGAPVGQDIVFLDEVQTVFVRASAPGAKPAIFGRGHRGSLRAKLWRAVADLIHDGGDRLIACPNCDEPFLALRKKKFCTETCTQKWHDGHGRKARLQAKQANGGRGR